ncbi:MAG: nodulation protein NfeD [Peptococcaceae bacterium]|nr:nodulation protein NfeD [Peptococcaceae bacterium]
MPGRKLRLMCILLLLVLSFGLMVTSARAEGRTVYVVTLEGEVDRHLPSFLERAFKAAERAGAEAVLLEISTPGGFVLSAFNIGDVINRTSIPIYAYVRSYALSAGAYIALASDALYMHAGSLMGAVEPVSADGTEVSEKSLSVVDAAMRSAAEKNGRDPEIASAMVRREISIPGVIEAGKLLTLSANEALSLGYTEGVVTSRAEVLAALGLGDSNLVFYQESLADRIARFLTSPTFSPILLSIAFAALVIEIFTAGFGVAGFISIAAFALYFGGHMVAGFAQWEYIAVFILGIALLMAEMFVSGFGFLGAAGLVFVAFSIVLSAETATQGLATLGWSLLITIALIAGSFPLLKRSTLWKRLVLDTTEAKEKGYVAPPDVSIYVGQTGIAVTPLRPSGTVELAGLRVDALTEGSYIAAETQVTVIGITGGTVVVKPANK